MVEFKYDNPASRCWDVEFRGMLNSFHLYRFGSQYLFKMCCSGQIKNSELDNPASQILDTDAFRQYLGYGFGKLFLWSWTNHISPEFSEIKGKFQTQVKSKEIFSVGRSALSLSLFFLKTNFLIQY